MVVKVLIRRRFKEGKTMEVYALLSRLRTKALDQPGYLTGETLVKHDNPRELLVISTWGSMESWLKWKECDLRKADEAKIEQYLESPTEYRAYVYGTYPQRK